MIGTGLVHENTRDGLLELLHRARSLPTQINGNEALMASPRAGRSSSREQLRKRRSTKKNPRVVYKALGFLLFVRFLQSCKSRIGVTRYHSVSCPSWFLSTWRTHWFSATFCQWKPPADLRLPLRQLEMFCWLTPVWREASRTEGYTSPVSTQSTGMEGFGWLVIASRISVL